MAIVGRYYMVPCLVSDSRTAPAANSRNLVPVIGPMHSDKEHLNFDLQHFHIDWRFVKNMESSMDLREWKNSPHGTVMLAQEHNGKNLPPVPRLMKCFRAMPEFPVLRTWKWIGLELAQEHACNKLKPGNICPHRGIDLTPFAEPDGTAICPGHGLRWNLRTGELIPRHAA